MRHTFGYSGRGLEKGWNLRKAEEKTSLDQRNIESMKNASYLTRAVISSLSKGFPTGKILTRENPRSFPLIYLKFGH